MKFAKLIAALFGALILAAVGVVSPALATTWTQVSDYKPPAGPISASAYPGAAQAGGWYDSSSKWSINSAGQLISTTGATGAYYLAGLYRPAAENAVDGQITHKFIQSSVTSASLTANWSKFRVTSPGTTSESAYLLNCGGNAGTSGALQIYKEVSGALTSLVASPAAYNPVAGTAYVCVANVVQTTSTSTTLTVTLYASDGVTQLATQSVADTTTALQNVSGQIGIYENNSATAGASNLIVELTTYTDITTAATTYTFSQSQTTGASGVTTSTLDVAPNGILGSSVVVTPSDGAGGSFSPSTLTLTGASNALFTYTPASTGTKTLSAPNGGGLTAPATLAYTSTAPPITIPANSAAFHFSPFNWKGDTGRGGSVFRQTWNAQAYFTVVWTASASPMATILIPTNTSGALISYVLNGALNDGSGSGISASGNVAISGILPSATNTLTVYFRSSPQGGEWNNGGTNLQIQGFQIDGGSGSAAGVAPVPTKLALIHGDSITVAFRADSGTDNALHGYAWFLGQYLLSQGYDYGVSASSGEGWIYQGDGSTLDVPGFYVCTGTPCTGANYSEANSRWDKIDAGVSLLDSNGQYSAYGSTGTPPSLITMYFGVNDYTHATGANLVQASVTAWLQSARIAAPNATILMIIEDALYGVNQQAGGSQTYVNAIKAGIVAANDPKVIVDDHGLAFGNYLYATPTGNNASYVYTDGTHPILNGHALIASRITAKVQSIIQPASPATFQRYGLLH